MLWRVEIKYEKGIFDPFGEGVKKSIRDFGITSVSKVDINLVYNLEGQLTQENIRHICKNLLADPVTQEFSYVPIDQFTPPGTDHSKHVIEIAYNRGVMDPVEHSTIKGIKDLGIKGIEAVGTAKQYALYGQLDQKQLDTIISKILSNKLIQHIVDYRRMPDSISMDVKEGALKLILVELTNANEKDLMKLSLNGQLFLNINEMKTIQKYCKILGRNPTDCELETIAQTWSEHCFHKTFRGNINYQYEEKGKTKKRLIRNLLKETIIKATSDINKSWCVSVFHDNAGIIKFDNDHHACFKVETHNHPSALEPFGGANTGVGGVIRDILGTGLGAKPVCSTDVFCFAPPDMGFNELPPGTLHPKRIMTGVVAGVRDYGNKMGIPTVNGAILFDKGFVGNPLVYCGNVGLIPKDRVKKKAYKGDLIVVVGGRTGRDGIHGATFSSGELTSESEVISSGAVQIGDPIQEKKMLDALMQARDLNLYNCITDCGAGGLSSAVGEMGQALGVRVQLEKVPLKYRGLTYTEIWISESQERMVLAVNPKKVDKFLDVFKTENVEATVIGEFTGTKKLELFYDDCQVCDLDMEFLHEGNPRVTKEALWKPAKLKEKTLSTSTNLNDKLKQVLSHYNVCSKEWVIRQYDHEVQGASMIKPLTGPGCDGPSDAAVITPKLGVMRGIAIANGINFRYGMIDPYWMAASCIDEAIRQVVAVGADVDRIAILDNFCWGNPDKPDRLGGLVRAALGCYDVSVGYKVPFISGKDSLYNEYTQNGKSIAIPGTLLISAIGIIEDISRAVTMDFKKSGNLIYIVGETFDELGGSIYLDTFGQLGNSVPKVNMKKGLKLFNALSKAIRRGLISSAHDCSEGGMAAAIAEMAFSGKLGATVNLNKMPYSGKEKRNDAVLFSESNSRFIVEVNPRNQKKFENHCKGLPLGLIGKVESCDELRVYGLNEKVCVNIPIFQLKEAWQKPLRFY